VHGRISAWLICGCAVIAALTACTHGGPSRELAQPPASAGSTASSGGAPSVAPSSIGGATTSRVPPTATLGTPTAHGSSAAHHAPRVLAPGGTNPSGVICDYVSRSDVDHVLPGTPDGQEIDLENTAVSYCDFGSASVGTVDVGVKNMGTSTEASAAVRTPYGRMSAQPDQSTHTFSVGGQFAFENASATPLKNGATLYAVSAQGSRGKWYVTIQYYAHRQCSASAMQHLLEAVLAKVPG